MKMILTAIAMMIAAPALAQNPADAHAGHKAATAPAAHADAPATPDKAHAGHDMKDGCCDKKGDGKAMACCDAMKAVGKKMACCDKMGAAPAADPHAGHDMSKADPHAGHNMP